MLDADGLAGAIPGIGIGGGIGIASGVRGTASGSTTGGSTTGGRTTGGSTTGGSTTGGSTGLRRTAGST